MQGPKSGAGRMPAKGHTGTHLAGGLVDSARRCPYVSTACKHNTDLVERGSRRLRHSSRRARCGALSPASGDGCPSTCCLFWRWSLRWRCCCSVRLQLQALLPLPPPPPPVPAACCLHRLPPTLLIRLAVRPASHLPGAVLRSSRGGSTQRKSQQGGRNGSLHNPAQAANEAAAATAARSAAAAAAAQHLGPPRIPRRIHHVYTSSAWHLPKGVSVANPAELAEHGLPTNVADTMQT